MAISRATLGEIATFSSLTCVQQSVMNFGILMVQGLVNSFGMAVMAAFAAAVKSTRLRICLYRSWATLSLPSWRRTSAHPNGDVYAAE